MQLLTPFTEFATSGCPHVALIRKVIPMPCTLYTRGTEDRMRRPNSSIISSWSYRRANSHFELSSQRYQPHVYQSCVFTFKQRSRKNFFMTERFHARELWDADPQRLSLSLQRLASHSFLEKGWRVALLLLPFRKKIYITNNPLSRLFTTKRTVNISLLKPALALLTFFWFFLLFSKLPLA